MNITHISDIDLRAKAGGMNTVIPLLIRQQIKQNHNGRIALLVTNSSISDSLEFQCFNLDSDYKSVLKESDIVVFHSVYNLKFIPLYQFLKKNEIPYVIVSHGAFSKPTQEKGKLKKSLFKHLFLDRFVRDAMAISFLTPDEQKSSIYPYKKYIIVPNVVEDNKSSVSNSLTLDNNDNFKKQINIVFMSKIDYHHKGLDILMQSLNSLKNELLNQKVVFNIYGYGKSKNIDIKNIDKSEKDVIRLIDDIRDYGLTDIVNYNGPVFGAEKEQVMAGTDIMILPSRSEGMPLTVIEFLGYGVPCIITKETNMGYFIEQGDSGWVSNFDSTSLANTISKAVSEYRKRPLRLKENAFKTYSYLNNLDIGSISIAEYKKLLKAKMKS